MAQKTSPFSEVKYGWNFGESGWNVGMDENLIKFSFLAQNSVDDIVSILPTARTGKSYFLTSDQRFYYSVEGTYYSTPVPKWYTFKNKTTGKSFIFDGSVLNEIPTVVDVSGSLNNLKGQLKSAAYQDTSSIVNSATSSVQAQISSKADLISPDFSGVVKVPNVAVTVDDRQAASTKVVNDILGLKTQLILNDASSILSVNSQRIKNLRTLGYYKAGDGGHGDYYVDLADTTSLANSGSVWVANDGARWKLKVDKEVSIKQFGATGVEGFQDSAIDNWIKYLLVNQVQGYLPKGIYRHSNRIIIDCAQAPGTGSIRIRGDGAYLSSLVATSNQSPSIHIYKSGPVNPDGQRVHTYASISDVGFIADTSGDVFTIGGYDHVDCAGNYHFKNVFVANSNSTNANASSLRLNYVFDCVFDNCVIVGKVGYGSALYLDQSHFCTFNGGSYSNALNGIVANGYNFNNTFTSPDLENILVGWLNVTVNDGNNILTNPFFDIYNPLTGNANGVAIRSLNSSSGGTILDSPYTQQRAGNSLLDPSNQVGVFVRGTTREQVVTPTFPASDVAVTNNTGRTILVRFSNQAGTLTTVFINGEPTPFTGGTITLLPRQTIAPRYTGTAPVWRWNAMV